MSKHQGPEWVWEGTELALVMDWPNHYFEQWGRNHECQERGLDVEEAYQNALGNFLEASKMSFDEFMDYFRPLAFRYRERALEG